MKGSKLSALIIVALVISACASKSAIEIKRDNLGVPATWSEPVRNDGTQSGYQADWLKRLPSADLLKVINQAVANNFQLQQSKLSLDIARQNVGVAGANLLPTLDASLGANLRKNANASDTSTSYDPALSLTYELDIWGKLNDNQRQASYLYASQQARYAQAKQTLIAEVILGWFKVVEANQQLALSRLKLKNTQTNLDIIESGYETGINSALDLYLTRNEVASEQSKLASQASSLKSAIRTLELLSGAYPAAALAITTQDMPVIDHAPQAGIPAQVVTKKPELQASWLALLAKDAAVAFTHKQRFPSIALTSNIGVSSDDLGNLLSSDPYWSLVGNLTAPLFNAGKLAANEEKARLETRQAEQSFLDAVLTNFADIENRLTQAKNLIRSYRANQAAAENANLAQTLSFEQYLKGLVSYTTVLDAQTRAFNAQSAVIQSKYQLLENRVLLHLALGGHFDFLSEPDQ